MTHDDVQDALFRASELLADISQGLQPNGGDCIEAAELAAKLTAIADELRHE